MIGQTQGKFCIQCSYIIIWVDKKQPVTIILSAHKSQMTNKMHTIYNCVLKIGNLAV